MEIKREILTALQLIGLLYLLFKSFTWNLPPNFDFFAPKAHLKSFPENSLHETLQLDKQSLSSEHDSANHVESKFGKRLPTLVHSMPPPFNIWKEIELTKQEQNEAQETVLDRNNLPRRKLNYASSKCGAKILAANKEAKYRMAILNEKIDEYMLNPCKAKSWFIVELCDNIAATQIELANYELYSSTPKRFSVFWSDVYPTPSWHHLGTFEATDRRTMQTFELESHNMGKFIKVIILSHYGKEHYCPLSVFRVLGYSMVYEYDNMGLENEKIKSEANETEKSENKIMGNAMNSGNGNSTHQEMRKKVTSTTFYKQSSISHSTSKLNKNDHSRSKSTRHKRSHQTFCLFLKRIILKPQHIHVCNNKVCRKRQFKEFNDNFRTDQFSTAGKENMLQPKFIKHSKIANNNTNTKESKVLNNTSQLVLTNLFRGKEHLLHSSSSNNFQFRNRGTTIFKPVERKSPLDSLMDKSNGRTVLKKFNVDLRTMNPEHKLREQNENSKINSDSPDHCVCEKGTKLSMDAQSGEKGPDSSQVGTLEQEESTGSAALIQKESVLVKLSSRMKASEMNLDLINRYLQQLSQSYRHQMEDMKNIFNVTLKAIHKASEEGNRIDEQQRLTIEHLEHQVEVLNYQAQYFSSAQRDILKTVLELHGFFLILEFIIMSTIFSIFVNKYQRLITTE